MGENNLEVGVLPEMENSKTTFSLDAGMCSRVRRVLPEYVNGLQYSR